MFHRLVRLSFIFFAPIMLIMLGGCGIVTDQKISEYHRIASTISVGDSQQDVLSKLSPIQQSIHSNYKRAADSFVLNDGSRAYIYYALSNRVSDGRQTDDEYTPYVFINGKLVSVGWRALGGPKTTATTSAGTGDGNAAANYLLMQQGLQMMQHGAPRTLGTPPQMLNCTTSRTGTSYNTQCW